ncbi:cation transport protein-domain-containing protein [Xylariales sp. PMI_506]|nr:cation transport protein-domain-containing protein [Xylariales sp. PMI_506]
MLLVARSYLPPLNFITLHYAYFITVCLVSSLIFWGSSEPKYSISYADSLFLVISAMTEAGLNTVNLSQMSTWQQVLLWLLIILGSSIWVSIWTVVARKRAFETRFRNIARRTHLRSPRSLEKQRTVPLATRVAGWTFGRSGTLVQSRSSRNKPDARDTNTGSVVTPPISGPVAVQSLSTPIPQVKAQAGETSPINPPSAGLQSAEAASARDHISFVDVAPCAGALATGIDQSDSLPRRRRSTVATDLEQGALVPEVTHRSFLTAKKIGRNAQFHDLTDEEREYLGGTEYRALKVLSVVVPLYFFSWQILGCIALGAWIAVNNPEPARANAISPWWNGIFNGVSAFNNSGMSVLDANVIPYGSSYFVLIVMGAMILAGNTAYPIFLRLWLWGLLRLLNFCTREQSFHNLKLTLEYILKYPRRVYTNLFPSRATWWLLFMIVALNGTDWVAFEILNLGNPALADVPVGSRIVDGLFQAIAVRSGGFYVVSIPTLYIGLQVLYVIMMYISVYPVVITMRHSNVYEERSLGIYADDIDAASINSSSTDGYHNNHSTNIQRPSVWGRMIRSAIGDWDGVGAAPQQGHDAGSGNGGAESRISFISHQVRGQLSHDLWLLVLAVLAITTIETRHFLDDPVDWSVFNVVFEVVSAYGCVGISVGVPFDSYSFSGGWYTGSKLVLCLVMLRGRHRGLPVALDRAVQLHGDGDDLGRVEEEDYRIRRSLSMRSMRRGSG